MGWLKGLFGSDPREQLQKAEKRLEGTPERALEMALEIPHGVDDEAATEVRAFIQRARSAVVEQALQRAAASEEEEYFADAAEWLEAAIEHTSDGTQRTELEARRKELLRQELLLDEEDDSVDGPAMTVHRQVEASVLSPELDVEALFSSLVDMFKEPVAERYRLQGTPFQRLFVQFQQAELDGLEEGLSQLLEAGIEDRAVVQLERGRLRLLVGDISAARQDLEACWQDWGDDTLDLADTLSLPGLWAEAKLIEQDFDDIVQRLPELAQPETGRLDVVLPYAQALVLSQRLDEAAPFLREAMGHFPSNQEFPQLYAVTLAGSGNPQEAMACLEMAIAPSCASGHCSKPAMHMPSLQMLLSLHVSTGDDEGRLRKLANLFVEHRRGQLSGDDHRLLAAVHHKLGEDIAEQLALEKAEEADRRGTTPMAMEAAPTPGAPSRLII